MSRAIVTMAIWACLAWTLAGAEGIRIGQQDLDRMTGKQRPPAAATAAGTVRATAPPPQAAARPLKTLEELPLDPASLARRQEKLYQECVEGLRSKEPGRRADAVKAIRSLTPKSRQAELLPRALELFSDETLLGANYVVSGPSLSGPLLSSAETIGEMASNVFKKLDREMLVPFLPAIKAKLKDSSGHARSNAARILSELNVREIIPTLCLMVANDPADEARTASLLALSRFKDTQAVPALIKVVEHDPLRDNRSLAIRILGDWKALGAEPALVAASQRDTDGSVRLCAMTALSKIGSKQAIQIAATHLNDQKAIARSNADIAIRNSANEHAIPDLLAMLGSSDAAQRRAAAGGLEKLMNLERKPAPAAIAPLVGALQDTDGEVRKRASEALSKIQDFRVADAMFKLTRDGDQGMRTSGLCYLCTFKDPRARALLFRALDDKDSKLRGYAAQQLALPHYRGGDVLIALEHVAQTDPDQKVRERAKTSLAGMRLTWSKGGARN